MTINTRAQKGNYPSAQIQPALNPFLGLLPKDLWLRAKDYFTYSIDFLPLGVSATASGDIQIQADSDFLIIAGVVYVTDTNNANPGPGSALVVLTDSGSGRQVMDRPVHIQNLFGTAQLPATWPFPKLMARSSTLQVQLQNLIATAQNYRISFLGFKIF